MPLPRVRADGALSCVRPIPFFETWRQRLGETFSARLLGPGDVVFVSDPESIKRLFCADRVNTIAPGRNIVLKPLLGRHSLLLQEGDEHLRRRKLMLPPFHGERMRAYEALIAEVTAAELAELAARRAVPAPPAHAGDHARGDHARRLRGQRPRAARRACARASSSILVRVGVAVGDRG